MNQSEKLGQEPIGKLLLSQALPAAIGFMVLSINTVVDTVYLGKYITKEVHLPSGDILIENAGKEAIGAITAISQIIFLFGVLGMGIGIGGASIVSRALGENNPKKANRAFNNQLTLMLIATVLIWVLGYLFSDALVWIFGAQGNQFSYGLDYFDTVLLGIPFLAWGMMCNNNIRAEGKAFFAMMILLIPSIVNVVLDDIFIRQMGGGMESAAWATTISFMMGTAWVIWFYASGKSELKVNVSQMKLKKHLVKEILAIGSVSWIRQGSIAILIIVLSWSLHTYGNQDIPGDEGGEVAYSSYGIASRLAMFAFFPLIGISQGFMPIAGYNYGAKKFHRVTQVIRYSIVSGTLIAAVLCAVLLIWSDVIPTIFSAEGQLLEHSSEAIFYVFMATPLVMLPFIGSSYYQAVGRPLPAMLLTLTKQTFFLIPVLLMLPVFFGLEGVWYSFPVADTLAALTCWYFLRKAIKSLEEAQARMDHQDEKPQD